MNTNQVAQQILDILFEDEDQGLTKHDIAVLLDLPASRIKSAMNAARVLAQELGMLIPTPVAEDGFVFRLTDNGDVIYRSQLFHERQVPGIHRVRKTHKDGVSSRKEDLAVEDRLMFEKMEELDEMGERHRAEARETLVRLAADMRRARLSESEDADQS